MVKTLLYRFSKRIPKLSSLEVFLRQAEPLFQCRPSIQRAVSVQILEPSTTSDLPPVHLPPPQSSLSASQYALSLRLKSPWSDSVPALIDSASGHRVSLSEFIHSSRTLASNLQSIVGLSKGDTAFVLSPNLIKVPILYFALLSLGVVVSPANPISTRAEISRLFQLSSPVIAFTTSSTAHNLPHNLRLGVVLLDSPDFDSLMTTRTTRSVAKPVVPCVEVSQSDTAAILYSSGTTGRVKGVMLTHRNLIALAASYDATRPQRERPVVFLYTVPYFHVYGFTYCLRSVVLSETVVLMERFRMEKMLPAVEEFRVTHLAVVPPIVVAMAKGDVTDGYNLSSLEGIYCGAAPLGKDAVAGLRLSNRSSPESCSTRLVTSTFIVSAFLNFNAKTAIIERRTIDLS